MLHLYDAHMQVKTRLAMYQDWLNISSISLCIKECLALFISDMFVCIDFEPLVR